MVTSRIVHLPKSLVLTHIPWKSEILYVYMGAFFPWFLVTGTAGVCPVLCWQLPSHLCLQLQQMDPLHLPLPRNPGFCCRLTPQLL